MNDSLAYLGITRRTTPLAIRERLQPDPAHLPAALTSLRDLAPERALLCTCERLELYAVTYGHDVAGLADGLADALGVPRVALTRHMLVRRGPRCAEHLLRVAAGLESRNMGEPQILRQVRDAYLTASAGAAVGPILSALFRTAIHTGRRVRRDTLLGTAGRSVARTAVEHVFDRLGALDARSVLIVGAGALAADVVMLLAARRTRRVLIVNRHRARAERLANRCAAHTLPMDRLAEALAGADVAIVCTAAPYFIVHRAHLAGCSRALLIIDLAMPRNVDPAIANVPGVRLLDLSALTPASHLQHRTLIAARRIVARQLERFDQWCRARRAAPSIVSLLRQASRQETAATSRHKRAVHAAIQALKNGAAA